MDAKRKLGREFTDHEIISLWLSKPIEKIENIKVSDESFTKALLRLLLEECSPFIEKNLCITQNSLCIQGGYGVILSIRIENSIAKINIYQNNLGVVKICNDFKDRYDSNLIDFQITF